MKINFTGHSQTERETELSQEEMVLLFEVMRRKFRDHIEYGKFNNSYPSYEETIVTQICENHQVDVEYKKDRVAFFEAVLNNMENPYE